MTEETEITFEYRLKDPEVLAAMEDVDLGALERIPFQTQIYYTTLEGMKCIRVITQLQDISHDREEAEKSANVALLSANAAQQAARMAQKGNFRQSQTHTMVHKRFMKSKLKNEDDA